MTWKCSTFEFDERMPIIMGILNVTPDSFSDGGEHAGVAAALAHAHRMLDEGAHIIDVGGESTRPGSNPVSPEEELARVIDVVKALAAEGVCVSIDTRRASVARAAVEAGAAILNDISGFRDPEMVKVACDCDAGLVVMHMKGDEPATMQNDTTYDDVVAEVREYLRDRAAKLESSGIARERICIDPGPGFGKTPIVAAADMEPGNSSRESNSRTIRGVTILSPIETMTRPVKPTSSKMARPHAVACPVPFCTD